ncbi:hypothetical protein [Roseibium sp. Sym1]|uniref:hypothetical protein n=1 Tax=Roseibium sp. Sym1 TaxID=3016006 RepID=UPI0022B3C1BC|nr:hypothetical protein [Roseibium sp. Sym1]
MVNGRPGGAFREKERAKREKIEENMLKNRALYLPRSIIAADRDASSAEVAMQARTRNAAANERESSQSIEFKEIFGMAG